MGTQCNVLRMVVQVSESGYIFPYGIFLENDNPGLACICDNFPGDVVPAMVCAMESARVFQASLEEVTASHKFLE